MHFFLGGACYLNLCWTIILGGENTSHSAQFCEAKELLMDKNGQTGFVFSHSCLCVCIHMSVLSTFG